MKRFWKQAAAVEHEGGWTIELDRKGLRTPARQPFLVPTHALASAIADEWNSAGETLDPRDLPLTGMANAAIDRIAPRPVEFAAGLSAYGESDLTCYRTHDPLELAQRQERSWDRLLDWARARFDADFHTTRAIIHVHQPAPTVQRLSQAVASLDPFCLAALSPLVTISGSLIASLALAEGAISADEAWAAVTIDDEWQREKWGEDAESEAALETRRRDFFAAARFMELLAA